MIVLNMFAGPGTGKSTTAAGVFAELKHRGRRAELVTEVAKEMCYDRLPHPFDQRVILREQYRRLDRLRGQVDVVVSDAPLLFGLIYATGDTDTPAFKADVRERFHEFENLNFFLNRVKPYATYGRTQDESEARALDGVIKQLPVVFARSLDADRHAVQVIANDYEIYERICAQ